MTLYRGTVAVVTGAVSGMGKALANNASKYAVKGFTEAFNTHLFYLSKLSLSHATASGAFAYSPTYQLTNSPTHQLTNSCS
jgi:hypothetical protein